MLRSLLRMISKTRATPGRVFARQAAAADVAGDGSRCQQAGNKSKDARLLTRHNAKLARDVKWTSSYGTQSRAACNRKNVNSKSRLPELALLLSARSTDSPATFLIHPKLRGMRNSLILLLWYLVALSKRQANVNSKSSLSELALLF